MLKLPSNINLSKRALGYLKKWQEIIDNEPDYKAQIEKAKKTWGKTNKTFDEIKEKLRLMSNSTERCSYCEDSFADEIEHIFPKGIYPEKTFVWENYLFACGPCNGPKSNKFSLIDSLGVLQNITPPKKIPVGYIYKKPPAHQSALINPREEDPTRFIELDIISTFRFIPALDLNPIEKLRANFTIELLRLNEREILIKARRKAYGNYRARLTEYSKQKTEGANQTDLNKLIDGIKDENHQTVWFEIKRFHLFIPELKTIFSKIPEALNW